MFYGRIRDSARHNVISKYIFRGGACAVRMLSQSARIMKPSVSLRLAVGGIPDIYYHGK